MGPHPHIEIWIPCLTGRVRRLLPDHSKTNKAMHLSGFSTTRLEFWLQTTRYRLFEPYTSKLLSDQTQFNSSVCNSWHWLMFRLSSSIMQHRGSQERQVWTLLDLPLGTRVCRHQDEGASSCHGTASGMCWCLSHCSFSQTPALGPTAGSARSSVEQLPRGVAGRCHGCCRLPWR